MKNSKSKKESNITHCDFHKTFSQFETLYDTMRSEHPEFIDAVEKGMFIDCKIEEIEALNKKLDLQEVNKTFLRIYPHIFR